MIKLSSITLSGTVFMRNSVSKQALAGSLKSTVSYPSSAASCLACFLLAITMTWAPIAEKTRAIAFPHFPNPLTSTFEPYIPCMLFCIAMDTVASAVTMAFCSMTVSSLIKSQPLSIPGKHSGIMPPHTAILLIIILCFNFSISLFISFSFEKGVGNTIFPTRS